MKIAFFSVGIIVFIMCEIFSVPEFKKNLKDGIYDTGIFAMQPLTGKAAARMNKFGIFMPRVGIIIYIMLGIYIFWG